MNQRRQRSAVFVLCVGVLAGASGVRGGQVDLLFDMGPEGSPVAEGAIEVNESALYSSARAYGWETLPTDGFNDESGLPSKGDAHYPLHLVFPGKDLYRDGFEADRPIRFVAHVPPGEYLVTAYVGRYQHARHDLVIRINGRLAAENVDAWGQVWGSQGGTPVKSVKTRVEAKNGAIHVEVDYEPSKPDSWKQYTTREPEGGRLWYLGQNKSSLLGVHIRSAPQWPIVRKGPRLEAVALSPPCRDVLEALNKSDIDKAIELLERADPPDKLEWVVVCDAVAGHIDTPDEKRIELLEASLKRLEAMDKSSVSVRERTEIDRRVLTALKYMRMWSYSQAEQQTGINGYKRYWGAYECCNPVALEDPLYPLSLLLKMRVSYWNGREGGWKHCYDLAREHAAALKEFAPAHPLVRMYLGESVPEPYQALPVPPDAPRWAVLQREALARLRKVIHYWVEHRQAENGELGGGWGDDVEILRSWVPLVLATNDEVARTGAKKIADGVYASGEIEHGYSKGIGDVEHAAEPVSDTQPLMMATQFGDPAYFEHCLETMRCMRDVWTARNKKGNLHFKSHYYSATKTVDDPPRSADVPLNGRAVKPGIWVLWYSDHPAVRELLAEWSLGWVAAAESTDGNKPAGIIPGSVSFPDGRIGGYADHWWQTKEYDDLDAMGYTATLYHVMLAAWAHSNNDRLLAPMFEALQAIRAWRKSTDKGPAPGTLEWVGQIHDSPKFFDVVEKWRLISGDERFDDLIIQNPTAVTRFRLTGETSQLERELQSIIDGLSRNLPMITTEVLFTDRVSIPGSTVLASMLTGSAGEPTYYPLHAVTWDGIGDDVAAFVTAADTEFLAAMLYAFGESECKVKLRLWRLEPGRYYAALDEDSPAERPLVTYTFYVREKGAPLTLELPPRRLLRLSIARRYSARERESLPDLAVGRDDLKEAGPGRVALTVHNIGTADAPSFEVLVLTTRRTVTRLEAEALAAPLDLVPRSTIIPIDLDRADISEIVVDPHDSIEELYESNNRIDLARQSP